jgi:hypothetical protein
MIGAGIASVEDLAGKTREDLSSLYGISATVVRRLEMAAGVTFRSLTGYWLERGLPPRVGNALVRHGVLTEADLRAVTREEFLLIQGLGETSLRQCEEAVGHALRSSKAFWVGQGVPPGIAERLSARRIETLERLREVSPGQLFALGLSWKEAHSCVEAARR